MPLRPALMSALLATACTEPLPQAPEGCEGIQCGCQVHTDCPLETPECLAGVCRESQATDIAWAHRNTVLPASDDNPTSDLHGVDLDRALDLSKGSLIAGLSDERPSPDWLLYVSEDGHRTAVHRGGLVLIRPGKDAPRIWKPTPRKLTSTGPGAHPDLRALAGYDLLKQFILSSTTAGMVRTRSPAQLLNTAAHKVILGKPFHHMIGDLIGPVVGRPAALQIPDVSKLMRRGYSLPHSTTISAANYPREDATNRNIGRTYQFTLQSQSTLRIDGLLSAGRNSCAVDMTIIINGEPERTWRNWNEPFIEPLDAGDYTLSFYYPATCPNENSITDTHWARLSIDSDQPITLHHWAPLTPLPVDNNARPVLYNEPAGLLLDNDGDNWPDNSDLCPQDADDQSDGDQNGIGDACDGFYSLRKEDGRLVALTRSGEEIGEVIDESINALSQTIALTLPIVDIPYPNQSTVNPYAVRGGIIFQPFLNTPVYEWFPGSEPTEIQGLRSSSLSRFDQPLILRQVHSSFRHVAMHMTSRLSYLGAEVDMQIMNMRTTVATATNPNQRVQSIHYLYSGSEPAFIVADPNEPLMLISDQNVGKATFSAMRIHATSLMRFPHVLITPPRNLCRDDSGCPMLQEGGLEVSRSCIQGRCTASASSGRCVRENEPSVSTFNACIPSERSGFCAGRSSCGDESLCAGFQCWPRSNSACAENEVCLPRNQTQADFAGIPLLPPGITRLLDQGALSPLAMTIGTDLAKATSKKYLGIVQALPMNRNQVEVALTACPREWMDGRQNAYLTLDEQRQLLRHIFNPNVAAHHIFEIAEVDANWVVPNSTEPPSSACRPVRSKWRGYFPSELAPQTAEFVDIDNDGINEFRVGFSVLERSQTAEPAVYRCFDFNGDHQANNCAP